MDWPQLSENDLARCRLIAKWRQSFDALPQGKMLRLRIASMGDGSGQAISQYIRHLGVTRIFEIGTCAGIGAAYMCSAAEANGHVDYVGMEGDERKRLLAFETLDKFCRDTVSRILLGPFDDTFELALRAALPLQFVYLDGYHKTKPTIHMFCRCVEMMPQGGTIVCDDLNWLSMKGTKQALRNHPRVISHFEFSKKDSFTIGAMA